jgi:hypothetical protein
MAKPFDHTTDEVMRKGHALTQSPNATDRRVQNSITEVMRDGAFFSPPGGSAASIIAC